MVQWSSWSIRSGSSAATTGSAFVRRNTRMPLRARSAVSAPLRDPLLPADRAVMNEVREPTSRGLVKSRIDQRSPRPFSIGVPVRAMRTLAGIRRSCWLVSFAGFLIACASSRTRRSHCIAAIASTSRTAVP